MNKSKFIKYSVVLIVIVLIVVTSFFLGWRIALSSLTIKTVTPTQAANAMKNDNFYSTFNENTLLIHGVISSVTNQNSDKIIGLTSDSSFKTLCDLGNISSSLQKGDTVTVLAGGATAERQPAAVMLKHCIKIAN